MDAGQIAAELERLLKQARSVGGLGHPAVQEGLDAFHQRLLPVLAASVELELHGTTVRANGAEVWAATGDEPPVLASTHRDGVRKLLLRDGLTRDELATLVEALARAARRSRSAAFSAATLLGERLWTGLRWAGEDGVLRGGVPEAGEAAPEEWFFGEAIPAPDPNTVSKPRKKDHL